MGQAMTMRRIADLVVLMTCVVVLALIAVEHASSNLRVYPYTQENTARRAAP